jgi:hypothetical protein
MMPSLDPKLEAIQIYDGGSLRSGGDVYVYITVHVRRRCCLGQAPRQFAPQPPGQTGFHPTGF